MKRRDFIKLMARAGAWMAVAVPALASSKKVLPSYETYCFYSPVIEGSSGQWKRVPKLSPTGDTVLVWERITPSWEYTPNKP